MSSAPHEAPTERREVARIQKGREHTLVIAVQTFHGRNFLDLRLFRATYDGERPTASGITIDARRLGEIQLGLIDAEGALEELDRR